MKDLTITFTPLNEQYLELVLSWRTSEHVTKNMYTDIEYSMKNQKRWFESTLTDKFNYYWIIHFNETPIGLISINKLDIKNKHCTFGYYIGDLSYSMLGGRIQPYLYNFVFNKLKLNKIYAEVLEGNHSMMKMHKFYGFREVGVLKEHIYKHDYFYDVHVFELLSSLWLNEKKKFHTLQAEFEMGKYFSNME